MTGNRDLFIGDVLHEAVVLVDEGGTEAATATAVIMELAASADQPVLMKPDHPFLFLIRDNGGAVLLAGWVINSEA